MGIKESYQIKSVLGAADLTLKADVGESLLIKGIYVYSAAGTYATLKIEKTTVGYFRIDETYGNHLAFPKQLSVDAAVTGKYDKNLLDLLFEQEIFTGYPVAEGESFVLSGVAGAADIKSIVYEIHDAADQKSDAPNGSKSKTYFLVNYGDTGAVIDAAGDHAYDNGLNPVEFPGFPFGIDVPAKTKILIHGIAGKEVGVRNVTPATAIYSTYLKLLKDRAVLFDEDRNGLMFNFASVTGTSVTRTGGGKSVIGNYDHLDTRKPLIFTNPLTFESGDELNIYMSVLEPVDASSIAALSQVIGLIQTISRAE